MRWKIETNKTTHVVSASSAGEALDKLKKINRSDVISVKLMPQNIVDKFKSKWRKLF